ncbi:Cache 3/Cache 2 fusion domain-containing protein [bacterium]|nr:Cache 3/Cache 2 fusion domain-containing protein [bacterium]
MITKIGSKLSFAFGILFLIVFLFTGSLIYFRVNSIITEGVDNNLNSISDLIKRIVMANSKERGSEIEKDLIVAEYFFKDGLFINNTSNILINTKNILNDEIYLKSYPVLQIGDEILSGTELVIDRIAEKTHGIIGFYQYTSDGFVLVSTNKHYDDGQLALGELIPPEASLYTLIMRDKTYFGRDYFTKKWYFTGYKLVYKDNEIIGALFVAQEQIQLDKLKEDILSINIGTTGYPYIIDQMTRVVIQNNDLNYDSMSYSDKIDIIFQRDGRIEYMQNNPVTGRAEKYVAFFKYIPDINWIVIVGSSMNDFYGSLYAVRLVFIIIYGISFILSLLLSIVLGHQITKPLVVIKDKIKEISEGEANLTKHLDINTNDEIGLLAKYFNQFMGNLRNIREVDQHGIELVLRDAQMNALQAQINPHFLYNTLETIRFMISLKDDRAIDMVQLLADLFRISIGRGEKYVTLQEEIEHAKLYLSIQKIRYSDKFSINVKIPEYLQHLYMVKFILQPIVENSILHGFEELEEFGVISITAEKQGVLLVLCVEDNGCGIDGDPLIKLNNSLGTRQKTGGIGLQNVHARIQLHFGINYGLEIKSILGQGTKVLVNLPFLKKIPPSTNILDSKNTVFLL